MNCWAYYGAVSDAVDVPIMYYNIPALTGTDLHPRTVLRTGPQVPGHLHQGHRRRRGEIHHPAGRPRRRHPGPQRLRHPDLLRPGRRRQGLGWGAASVSRRLCADLYQALAVDGNLADGRGCGPKSPAHLPVPRVTQLCQRHQGRPRPRRQQRRPQPDSPPSHWHRSTSRNTSASSPPPTSNWPRRHRRVTTRRARHVMPRSTITAVDVGRLSMPLLGQYPASCRGSNVLSSAISPTYKTETRDGVGIADFITDRLYRRFTGRPVRQCHCRLGT